MMIARLWTSTEIGYWGPFTEGESLRGEAGTRKGWRDGNKYSSGHVEFEVPSRHSSGDAKFGSDPHGHNKSWR